MMDTKKQWPTTISAPLFEAWQKLQRPGDTAEIIKIAGYSRPVISRALNSGYVSTPGLVDIINHYFFDRIEKEKQTAAALMAAGHNSKPKAPRAVKNSNPENV